MTKTNNKRVTVDLQDRSYDIVIGNGLFEDIESHLPFDLDDLSVFVLTDDNVKAHHGQRFYDALQNTDAKSVALLSLPAGEKTKSMGRYEQVLSWMLDHGVNRQSVLFTVGGGVIGDLGGFVAASMMRGIRFVQVPTSLLAQVDSSVGGKTGIDMPQGKNLVGAFHQPAAVLCDLDVLNTLPERELRAGYAEIVKYGLINDPAFFKFLEDQGADVLGLEKNALMHAIETSCLKKAGIVAQDEYEAGVRALLNLGHTFGHALEAAAGYDGSLLHGEAISIGMVMAFDYSVSLGLCGADDALRVKKHFESSGLPVRAGQVKALQKYTADDFMAYIAKDKKVYKSTLTFILTKGIGGAFVQNNVDPDGVRAILEQSF